MKRPLLLVILNTIGFILTIILNGIAVYLPLNGKTTGELSDLYPNLFVPSGVTFSIWGIIYLLLLLFILYQWFAVFSSSRDESFIYQIGQWFFVSSLANSSWIIAWHFVFPVLSLAIMIVLLFSLIKIYTSLNIGKTLTSASEKMIVHSCFSVYLGWITVATIANVTTVLVFLGWGGGSIHPAIWTIIMIVIASLIGMLFTWSRRDYLYAFVIIWALFGIYLKRNDLHDSSAIVLAAQVGMISNAIVILFRMMQKWLIRTPQ